MNEETPVNLPIGHIDATIERVLDDPPQGGDRGVLEQLVYSLLETRAAIALEEGDERAVVEAFRSRYLQHLRLSGSFRYNFGFSHFEGAAFQSALREWVRTERAYQEQAAAMRAEQSPVSQRDVQACRAFLLAMRVMMPEGFRKQREETIAELSSVLIGQMCNFGDTVIAESIAMGRRAYVRSSIHANLGVDFFVASDGTTHIRDVRAGASQSLCDVPVPPGASPHDLHRETCPRCVELVDERTRQQGYEVSSHAEPDSPVLPQGQLGQIVKILERGRALVGFALAEWEEEFSLDDAEVAQSAKRWQRDTEELLSQICSPPQPH